MHRTFAFWSMRLSREYTSILHNRRACSALQGIGGRATNKQSAKSTTIALLATIEIVQIRYQLRKLQLMDNLSTGKIHDLLSSAPSKRS